ncbi:MAG: hypothetical protein NTY01_02015 [Verrucomicrobia bacterium]|nr:hypothetical protein [Verrucomicrobiota bacterium]
MISRWFFLIVLLASFAQAAPSLVEPTSDNVRIVRDDTGQWGGASMGMTHQSDPRYQAKKILDLSAVSEAAWAAARDVRLSAFFCVRDYSLTSLGKANGLDEAFEVVVNGKVHLFPNNGGAPVYADGKSVAMAWFDFAMPKQDFIRGRNEIVFRKAPTPTTKTKPDDYLYLGIDNSSPRDNSTVSFDGGKTWLPDKLNSIGARGEYMVRLVLLSGERSFQTIWRSGATTPLNDPAGVILYAGTHDDEARLEWEPSRLDVSQPVTAVVETTGAAKFKFRWLDADGKPLPPVSGVGPRFETTLKGKPISGVVVDTTVQSLAVRGVRGYHTVEAPINICPPIAQPAGKPAKRKPACRVEQDGVLLENGTLRCRFTASGRLKLVSVFNELANAEIVRQPNKLDLFLVEIGTNHCGVTVATVSLRSFSCPRARSPPR